jgi:hypothetical protein
MATYTQEQLDIALLKQKDDEFMRTLSDIKSTMNSNFHTLLGLILGIYGVIAATALAKLAGLI